MTNSPSTAAQGLDWNDVFCERYAFLTLDFAQWFLILALLVGAIWAGATLLQMILKILRPPPADDTQKLTKVDPDALSKLLDAIKGLVGALGTAPPWFALFLAGVLLLWMADNSVATSCKIDVPEKSNGAPRS